MGTGVMVVEAVMVCGEAEARYRVMVEQRIVTVRAIDSVGKCQVSRSQNRAPALPVPPAIQVAMMRLSPDGGPSLRFILRADDATLVESLDWRLPAALEMVVNGPGLRATIELAGERLVVQVTSENNLADVRFSSTTPLIALCGVHNVYELHALAARLASVLKTPLLLRAEGE